MKQRRHAAPATRRSFFSGHVLLFVLGFLLTAASAALAYWTMSVHYRCPYAVAQASSLSPPTMPVATVQGGGAITIGWSLPSKQLAGAQYRVIRTSGQASAVVVCTVEPTATSCEDTGLAPGTNYRYAIMAVLGTNWESSSITTSATTATTKLAIALSPGPYTAGRKITVTSITATNGTSTDTTYSGTKTISWSGFGRSRSGEAPVYPPRTLTFVSGVASLESSFVVYAAGTSTLWATDAAAPAVTGSVVVEVNPAAESKLAITKQPCSAIAAGGTLSLSVAVEDAYGNAVATGVGSTDHLTVALSAGKFSAGTIEATALGGVATFSGLQIKNTGTYTITATDATHATVAKAISKPFSVDAGRLVFTSSPRSGPSSSTPNLGPITVERENGKGGAITSGRLRMNLASSPSAGATFGETRFASTTETTITFAQGVSKVTFWYGETTVGIGAVTVSARDYVSATQNETITLRAFAVVLSSAKASFGDDTRALTLQEIRATGPSFSTGNVVVTMTNIGPLPVNDVTATLDTTRPGSALTTQLSVCEVSAGYVIYNGVFSAALVTQAVVGTLAVGQSDTYTINIYAGDEETPCGSVRSDGARAVPGISKAPELTASVSGERLTARLTAGYSG